jgi:predicted nuclease of predicted toxin-antitoxin system
MRFLADESCDFAAVRALRTGGHDVLAVAEITHRSIDREAMALAAADDRVLLTEDKDFGWLAFVAREPVPGVVLIRYPAHARAGLGRAILDLVDTHGVRLGQSFTVLQPGAARIARSIRR